MKPTLKTGMPGNAVDEDPLTDTISAEGKTVANDDEGTDIEQQLLAEHEAEPRARAKNQIDAQYYSRSYCDISRSSRR